MIDIASSFYNRNINSFLSWQVAKKTVFMWKDKNNEVRIDYVLDHEERFLQLCALLELLHCPLKYKWRTKTPKLLYNISYQYHQNGAAVRNPNGYHKSNTSLFKTASH